MENKSNNQNLFNALVNWCGVSPLESDMRELIDAVNKDAAQLSPQVTDEQVGELADLLADEAFGDKGRYLYSERQLLSAEFSKILQNKLPRLSSCGDRKAITFGVFVAAGMVAAQKGCSIDDCLNNQDAIENVTESITEEFSSTEFKEYYNKQK